MKMKSHLDSSKLLKFLEKSMLKVVENLM